MNPKIFIINKTIVNKCKEFSEKVITTTNYSDSNQNDKTKEALDHFIGKVGEYGAYYYLKSIGINTSEPDCNVYEKKSWEEDLLSNDKSYGVKTQSYSMAMNLAKKFNIKLSNSISWTFQYGDKRKDTVFNRNDNNMLFTLYVKKFKSDIDRVLVFPIKEIGNIVFKESLMDHVKSSKKIAYGIDNYSEFESWLNKFGV